MAHTNYNSMNSNLSPPKQHNNNIYEDTLSINQISHALQTNNVQSALEMFQILLQQNKSMSHKLHKISHEATKIKSYSNELHSVLHDMPHKDASDIAQNIKYCAFNILSTINSNAQKQSEYEMEESIVSNTTLNGLNEHDLSRIVNGIESSVADDSSIMTMRSKSESMTFVTDEHMDTLHERRGSHSHLQRNTSQTSQSSDDQSSKQEMIKKLESGGRIYALIEKSQTKKVSKQKMIKFLEKKGVSQSKISEAYNAYYDEHNLTEIMIKNDPLPFEWSQDNKGKNCIVTKVKNKKFANNIKIGSYLYEINGKRVDGKKHERIIKILNSQSLPFCVVFKEEREEEKEEKSQNSQKLLHEHSMISVYTKESETSHVIAPIMIDWEQIGQILLDHRFLATARLINHALDHLETFCNDEDLHENNLRDELCKAWSLEDDRGTILWQILYGNLRYSVNERKWFYDLLLHRYFKLNDMKLSNMVFLITKILRSLNEDGKECVDLVLMKEILAMHKIDGFSFNNGQISNCDDFIFLFEQMPNFDDEIWRKVYFELIEWKIDSLLQNEHICHQKKYKNAQDKNEQNENEKMENKENEITIFNDMTLVSIRRDIDYSDSEQRREWKTYRHRIKNVFIFFAGFKASRMRQKEFKRFCDIFGLRRFNLPIDDDLISMDEFVKFFCNVFINEKAKKMKKHIENTKEWKMILNALNILDEFKSNDGMIKFEQFDKFGKYLGLDELDVRILFHKIDKKEYGQIHIDQMFEWFKKKLKRRKKRGIR